MRGFARAAGRRLAWFVRRLVAFQVAPNLPCEAIDLNTGLGILSGATVVDSRRVLL